MHALEGTNQSHLLHAANLARTSALEKKVTGDIIGLRLNQLNRKGQALYIRCRQTPLESLLSNLPSFAYI